MALIKYKDRTEAYFAISLVLLTVLILAFQYIGFERSLVIDLTASDKIYTRDDRLFGGSSTSLYKQSEKGLEFSCQITSEYAWPYCELVFDLRKFGKNNQFLGYDFSSFDRVGLWIIHNHEDQAGTRFEMHNFNENYSIKGVHNSLKYNTIEFSSNNVHYPTWINLDSLVVPTWWNASNHLTSEYWGTDFSNIHTMALVTGGLVNNGLYQLTVERIEFRGRYIETESLLLILIIIWSIAAGYFLRRFSSIKINYHHVNKEKEAWEVKATNDPLTGALNRVGFRELLDKKNLNNTTYLCLIYIDIDHFKMVNDTYGHNVGDEILKQFVRVIKDNCRINDSLVRWGGEEFLLFCAETKIESAAIISEKIRKAIEVSAWPNAINLTCSLGVVEKKQEVEDFQTLIERADRALYRAKDLGRNRSEIVD